MDDCVARCARALWRVLCGLTACPPFLNATCTVIMQGLFHTKKGFPRMEQTCHDSSRATAIPPGQTPKESRP